MAVEDVVGTLASASHKRQNERRKRLGVVWAWDRDLRRPPPTSNCTASAARSSSFLVHATLQVLPAILSVETVAVGTEGWIGSAPLLTRPPLEFCRHKEVAMAGQF